MEWVFSLLRFLIDDNICWSRLRARGYKISMQLEQVAKYHIASSETRRNVKTTEQGDLPRLKQNYSW